MTYWSLPEPETSRDLVLLMMQRYLAQGGEAGWHYWSNLPGELGGWRPNFAEVTPIPYRECLAVLDRLVPNGQIMIQPVTRPTLTPGLKPQASEGPGESSCSGSFCEIADRHDKGGLAA